MRVKTAPRQRIIQSNKDGDPALESSESFSKDEREVAVEDVDDVSSKSNNCKGDSLNENRLDNPVENEGKEDETLNYCQDVLDMSMKRKSETPEKDSSTSIAGPSSCEYSSSPLEEENSSNCDNNNTLTSNANIINSCSITTCPCTKQSNCEDKLNGSSSDEDQPTEAVNLCKKDCYNEDTSTCGESDEKLKDTFLYKIMTDPTFLENIQKHKQPKRYVCQFCKQEFVNGDELADHMDVKKDESNQVVCCACKKTFAQKRYLRYHQRCHSERSKFTCDICTKKYTRLDNLTRHNAFHVNPDKFSCTYCEKTFARKDLLNKHLKYHDNKYRFSCELCHKYFKGPVMLEKHKKIFHTTP